MNIIQNLVSKSKYSIKCPNSMVPEFIVVHNTANDASAKNEIKYMITNDNQVSFHFAVDDVEVVQGLPLDRNAWACGDGANGHGNRKGIQVEICYSKSGGVKFENAEKNAAKLIAQLLRERGWGVDKVKKHQDFSGKYCPHRTLDKGWASFVNMISDELKGEVSQAPSETQTSDVIYQVIVGSYLDRANANSVKSKLDKIYTGVWINVIKKNGQNFYQVISGSYKNKANAETIKSKLDKSYSGVWINVKK